MIMMKYVMCGNNNDNEIIIMILMIIMVIMCNDNINV